MLAAFFTKPLQGNLFRKFRDVILGHKHIDSLKDTRYPSPTPSRERVGGKEIVGNGADGHKADGRSQQYCTYKITYAAAARNKANRVNFLRVRGA
jgi:hypothetical protein